MTDPIDQKGRPVPAHWLRALDAAEADVAAGRVVEWTDVRRELVERLAKLEKKTKKQA